MKLESLYPDPPHLSVTAWAPGPEQSTFAAMGRAVEAAGGVAVGLVATVQNGVRFGDPIELAGLGAESGLTPHRPGDRLAALIEGRDPTERAVQAGYLAGRLANGREDRLVVVQYDAARPDEPHPVSAAMDADLLGVPEDLWRDDQPARARELSAWILALFQDAQQRTGSLYGSIEVERDLPSPAGLREEEGLYGNFYVSAALTQDRAGLLDELRRLHPDSEVSAWPGGYFFAAWEPFRRDDRVGAGPDEEVQIATGILIGKAVQRHLEQ